VAGDNFRTKDLFQVEVFCVVKPCNGVLPHGNMDLWNMGILPQHYTASHPGICRQHGPLKCW